MANVSFVVTHNDVPAKVARLQAALSLPALTAFLAGTVSPYLAQQAATRFANEGDDLVGQWAPLAEATVAFRESEGFNGEHPINIRTGEMERWVTNPSPGIAAASWGGIGGVAMEWPSPVPGGELGDKVAYAQGHSSAVPNESGSPNKPRPILAVGSGDLLFVMTKLQFLLQAVT